MGGLLGLVFLKKIRERTNHQKKKKHNLKRETRKYERSTNTRKYKDEKKKNGERSKLFRCISFLFKWLIENKIIPAHERITQGLIGVVLAFWMNVFCRSRGCRRRCWQHRCFRVWIVRNVIAGKGKLDAARIVFKSHRLGATVESLRVWILLDSGDDILGQLVQKHFLVLLIRSAFGHFASSAQKVAKLARQRNALLVRTLHFAFTDLNACSSFSEIPLQILASHHDAFWGVDHSLNTPTIHFRLG